MQELICNFIKCLILTEMNGEQMETMVSLMIILIQIFIRLDKFIRIWTINNGHLQQSDQTSANTNIYTNVLQNNENIYLYHWQMKISGEGTNRRAGLYVFVQILEQFNV